MQFTEFFNHLNDVKINAEIPRLKFYLGYKHGLTGVFIFRKDQENIMIDSQLFYKNDEEIKEVLEKVLNIEQIDKSLKAIKSIIFIQQSDIENLKTFFSQTNFNYISDHNFSIAFSYSIKGVTDTDGHRKIFDISTHAIASKFNAKFSDKSGHIILTSQHDKMKLFDENPDVYYALENYTEHKFENDQSMIIEYRYYQGYYILYQVDEILPYFKLSDQQYIIGAFKKEF